VEVALGDHSALPAETPPHPHPSPSRGREAKCGKPAPLTVRAKTSKAPTPPPPKPPAPTLLPPAPASPGATRRPRGNVLATHAPDGRIIFSEKFACPVSGLFHRPNRAAPVQLQRAAGACPGWRRPRRGAALRSRPDRPQRRRSASKGRGRPWARLQPAPPIICRSSFPGRELASS